MSIKHLSQLATKIHQILRQSLMCWHHCQVQLRQRAINPRNWWNCLCFSRWCCCRKTCCLTTTPGMNRVWICLPCFLPFYLSPFRSFVLTASHTWPTPRTRCCLSELPAHLLNANETYVGCNQDLLSFSMALFFSLIFMWIGRCQVILVVTPVSTCTQNESKGETHLCFLCSDWFICPFMFLLIYRFGSQLSTLLCFLWICCPFCSFFLLDYIYGQLNFVSFWSVLLSL